MSMDVHRFAVFKILTVSLSLIFCLLLSWASSTTTTPPPSPPPPSSSVLSAAQILHAHGYSFFATALISTSSTTANFSGTILAPPDFAFSFATAKFSSKPFRHALPRPSTALLHYHTLQTPSLVWFNLTSRPHGDEVPTHYGNNCLFLFKNASGNVAFSSSKKPIHAITIRQPDLYSDDTLTIHGVDGVLDPTAAKKCSFSYKNNPTAGIQSPADRSFLDHAIRVLRMRGFHVVATAMVLRRSELLTLKAVTVFAPSDIALFSKPDGFNYDFGHHIVPKRLRLTDITTFLDGTESETLIPHKTVFIRSGEGDIRVNGIRVDGGELYHNRWIVVYAVSRTLDDAVDEYPSALPESHFPGKEEIGDGFPTTTPASTSEMIGGQSPCPEGHISGGVVLGVPVVAPMSDQGHLLDITGESIKPPSLSPEILSPSEVGREVPGIAPTSGDQPIGPSFPSLERQIPDELALGTPIFAPISGQAHIPDMTHNSVGPLSPASTIGEVTDLQCSTGSSNDVVPGFTVGIEGGDLFCPVNNVQDL